MQFERNAGGIKRIDGDETHELLDNSRRMILKPVSDISMLLDEIEVDLYKITPSKVTVEDCQLLKESRERISYFHNMMNEIISMVEFGKLMIDTSKEEVAD